MRKLVPIVIGAIFWAWMTEASTRGTYGVHRQSSANSISFFMLVLTLALPITLRTSFNDTHAYIRGFNTAPAIDGLMRSGALHLLRNPLFVIYRSLVRTCTDNKLVFFLFPAFFVQYSYARFIRRHSPSFLMGIALYLFLGAYVFSMAAMKQTIAMAILLYGVDGLIEGKLLRFYLLVVLAFLFHTYAIVFLILPFFTVRPWSFRSFLLLFGVLFVMAGFETVMPVFLDLANGIGMNVSSEELLGAAAINPIRVAVYAVTPLFALVFRRYLFTACKDREHNILVNMSFITAAIMSVGLIGAANMFARMGQYFEFGIICGLPWMLGKPFEKSSERLICMIALVCFAGFFCYANLVQIVFDDNFVQCTLMEALGGIWNDFLYG